MDDILLNMACVPCTGSTPRLTEEQIKVFSGQLQGWELLQGNKLFKGWKFGNFKEAFDFVARVSAVAELEAHHPDVAFGWGYVKLTIWTYAIEGLSENDFILAAKLGALSV